MRTRTAELPPSAAHIVLRQQEYPIERDRAMQLFRLLGSTSEHAGFETLIDSGILAIGEIGQHKPDIRTVRTAGNGSAIEFCSGMMDFVYSVSRALAGAINEYADGGRVNTALLDVGGIAPYAAQTLAEWGKRWGLFGWLPWNRRRIKPPVLAITKSVGETAEELAKQAALFMLAHELGHVAEQQGMGPHVEANPESKADALGLALVLNAHEGLSQRMPYAGAVFAVRVLKALENRHVRFSDQYPPATERLSVLRTVLHKSCPSTQAYHEVSTIAVAYMGLMDEVDYILTSSAPRSPGHPSAEQALITLIAILEEGARGRLPKEQVIDDFSRNLHLAPATSAQAIANSLVEYYLLNAGVSYLDLEIRRQMGVMLVSIVVGMPEMLKNLFPLKIEENKG